MPLASRLALVTNEETNETMTCLPTLEASEAGVASCDRLVSSGPLLEGVPDRIRDAVRHSLDRRRTGCSSSSHLARRCSHV